MSHLPLDARAILEYLNELGYRNISAAQLKEFMKDLRKLIMYEEKLCVNTNQDNYFENLYKRTTASYRAKIDKENAQPGSTNGNGSKERLRNVGGAVDSSTQIVTTSSEQLIRGGTYDAHKSRAQLMTLDRQQPVSALDLRASTSAAAAAATADNRLKAGGRMRAETDVCIKRLPRKDQMQQERWCRVQDLNSDMVGQQGRAANCRDNWDNVCEKGAGAKEARSRARQASRDNSPVKIRGESPRERIKNYVLERQHRRPLSARTGSSPQGRARTHSRSPSRDSKGKPLTNDPVALYHYYERQWRHFRLQIPGESSHAKLRWSIRSKLRKES